MNNGTFIRRNTKKKSMSNTLGREMYISKIGFLGDIMRVRSKEGLSCPELRPHRVKAKSIGFLEGNSEPLILCLDFL